jgi:O-antigen ligase/polysaccharide polymerase Wzy-like membrane protein
MPAEQALRRAQRHVAPGSGRGGGESDAWRARLEESAALISPLLLLLGLAIAGGGFGLSDRHAAGLAVWLVVAALLALGAAGRATLGRPFYWGTGLIGALALFSAFSSLWSGSIELSVIEADRVLAYLGFFVAAFLIAQTEQSRQRFGEGISIALVAIALLALATRLLPDLISLAEGPGTGVRLSYPLGYWNGDGVVFGIATGLALWLSRRALGPAQRWFAAVSLPAVLLALYFTYSRGGLLATAIACGCLIALSHDRLWLLATLGAGALGALPAVLAVQGDNSLAENLGDGQIAGQGREVLAILVAGMLLTAALFWLLNRLEQRQGRLTDRALAASRNPRVLRGVALAAALLALVAAIAVGGRAWDQFSSPDLQPPGSPQGHFTELGGSGRGEFWRVALDAFDEKPILGHGAGTYRFSWHLLRHNSVTNIDAHSLYLQPLAELGLVGGLLVLAMMGTLLWTGVMAWRGAWGRQRDLYAALLGAALAFAVCAAIDWFWSIATMGAIFFLATGVLVAARCAQLSRQRAAANGHGEQRRFGLAVAGLAVAWISALALVGPLLVDHEIDASNSAAAEGNIASAVSHADTARSVEPWATSPYKQLGLLAESQSDYATAIHRFTQAIEREEENWLLYYLRARVENKAGDEAAAKADFAEALRLNPEEQCLGGGFEGCG